MTVGDWAGRVRESVERAFFGKSEVVDQLLVAVAGKGHVLLEDVPGTGKTILARALAASMQGQFRRIQCTPDLMPSDVLGVSVYMPSDGTFQFREGPITANIVLVDEINRATPRTQAALLEAMAERQITVDGKTIQLPEPFLVIATENPIEFEGTFPLPEAQRDRFFMTLRVGYPTADVEKHILHSQRRQGHPVEDIEPVCTLDEVRDAQRQVVDVHVEPKVVDYILAIVHATREEANLRLGASPRATLALYRGAQAMAAVDGRDFVLPDDVKRLAPSVLEKRVILTADAQLKGVDARSLVSQLVGHVPVPVLHHSE